MRRTLNRIFLIVLLGGCLGTEGFNQKRDPAPVNALVGPIRSLKEWDVYPNGRRKLSSIETYDRNGRLINRTVYQDGGGILYGDENTYDAIGRLTETHTVHSPHTYLPDKQVRVYDKRGNVIEVKGYDSAGKHLGGELFEYDSKDNVIEKRIYLIGSHLVYNNHLTRHIYDARGNEIASQQYVSDESRVRPDEFGMGYQKQVFLNDKNGRATLIGYLKSDNRLVRTETRRYDLRGNTVEEIERSVDGRVLRRVSYSYVFDRLGNWIKQVRREYTAEGVGSVFRELEVYTRTILYYRHPYDKAEDKSLSH